MFKSIKLSLLITLLLISACTAAEFLIKRTINDFEGNAAKELNSLAKFTPEQKLAIDATATATDAWMRSERLVMVNSLTLMLADDIENQGQISSNNWNSVAQFLSIGLGVSQSPNLVNRYVQLAMSLTQSQLMQVQDSFDEELEDWLKRSEKITVEKQNERIVDGLKWVFRAIDQPLTRDQRNYAKEFLSGRKVDFDYQRQMHINETNQLNSILSNAQTMNQDQVYAQILDFFKTEENAKSVPTQQAWQYNVDLFLELINYFLNDLDQQQRQRAAIKLRDYAGIFEELSNKGS